MQTVNRPPTNKNVKRWLRYVCEMASAHTACLFITCDTAEQVEVAVRRAAKLLPRHKRTAVERMYDAASRADPVNLN